MHNHRPAFEQLKWTHFYARPLLINSLKASLLTPDGQLISPGCTTMLDVWQKNLADKFFDMGTMIRLGSVIENSLKYYYMDKKGHTNLVDLANDPKYRLNIFQQVQSWQTGGAIDLFKTELGLDITTNAELVYVQEGMMHRHLYAHNSGLLNDDYINKIKLITGEDLRADPAVTAVYPLQDTYWFKPLNRLTDLINHAESFFAALT